MEKRKLTISVVIPAYNEEKTIGKLIRKIPGHCEIIVVDDNSDDGTAGTAESLGALVLRNKTNRGYDFSIERGIQKAGGDVIITMDADGEHDPGDIPRLVERITEDYDLVLAERDSLPRLSERLIAWLVRRRAPGIRDATTGFRAFRKSALRKIPLRGSGFGACLILRMHRAGMGIGSVKIKNVRRVHPKMTGMKIFRGLAAILKEVCIPKNG